MLTQMSFYCAGKQLDVQGTNLDPYVQHRASTTVQKIGKEQDGERSGEESGEEIAVHHFSLFFWTAYPVASGQYQNRETLGYSHCFPISATVPRCWSLDLMARLWSSEVLSAGGPQQCSHLNMYLNRVEINEFCLGEIACGWILVQIQECRLCDIWVLEPLFGIVE